MTRATIPPPRPCRRFRRDIWREVDGLLSPARSRRLLEHVSSCPGCHAHLEAALHLDRALSKGAPALPREGFEERVLLGIASGLDGEPAPAAPAPRRRPSRRAEEAADWWVLGGGLGAAAVVGLLAVSVVPRLALRATMAAAGGGSAPVGDTAMRWSRFFAGFGEALTGWIDSPLAAPLILMGGILAITLAWIHFTLSRSTS